MTDIVERLRAEGERQSEREARALIWRTLSDAADEIERLREVLRNIATIDIEYFDVSTCIAHARATLDGKD